MWKPRKLRLTIPQRLFLLTAIPILALIGIGQMSFRSAFAEHRRITADAHSLEAYQSEVREFLSFANVLLVERSAAMQVFATSGSVEARQSYQSAHAATNQAVATMFDKLDRLSLSPTAALFEEKAKQVRTAFQTQLPDARKKVLENSVSSGEVFQQYMKLTYTALFISECYRQQISTPAALNLFDALFAVQKLHQQELVALNLFELGVKNGGLPRIELGLLRRQFFVSTENEYYLLKFQPDFRAFFKTSTRPTADDNAFYNYMIEQAGTLAENTPPPAFTPKEKPLPELIAAHFRAYEKVYEHTFGEARRILGEVATERRTHAIQLGVLLGAALLVSLGVNVAITRSTKRTLVGVSRDIDMASSDVQTASTQLSAAGEQIAQSTSDYASAIDTISHSIDEVSSMAEKNKTDSVQAARATGETRAEVDAGLATIGALDTAMNSARESGHKINQIIARINDISFQTNLLALNAAVEAARAGEAGAGFAVVANEVRELSKRCAEAAQETADLISESTHSSAVAIEKSDELAARFKKVSAGIRSVDGLVARINASLAEQAGSINVINTSVTQQREIAQNLAASAEETASTALSMHAQVTALEGGVAKLDVLLGLKAATSKSSEVHRLDEPALAGTVQ